jgi:hypothetical protein
MIPDALCFWTKAWQRREGAVIPSDLGINATTGRLRITAPTFGQARPTRIILGRVD